jgi:LPPG:FO 2-phospho-L-lactate transferase
VQLTMLGGGIGASRLSKVLVEVVPPEQLTCVVNTADDLWQYGLRVCPDIDTTLYAHAGWKDDQRGWGLKGDSFRAMEQLRRFNEQPWFNLGDLDLATHLLRTTWLNQGLYLSLITSRFAEVMGVRLQVLPMSDQPVETQIKIAGEWYHYQEFLVQRDARDRVEQVAYQGIKQARPAPGVIEAILGADLVLIAPSNPFASVVPLLSLPGVRQALNTTKAPVIAVTPIVATLPINDPDEAKRARSRAALLAAHGLPHTASAVASLYADFVDLFVLDEYDAHEAAVIEALGMKVMLASTLVHTTNEGPYLVERMLEAALVQA